MKEPQIHRRCPNYRNGRKADNHGVPGTLWRGRRTANQTRQAGAACRRVLLVGSGILLFVFHNIRQERQARRFFALLRARDYQGAYALWAPTESDRRSYPIESFLEDWGPDSGRGDPNRFRVAKSRSCGSGVILTVDSGKAERERLWVQRDSLVIGFPPPADGLPRICRF
jgi:hypothetical protein